MKATTEGGLYRSGVPVLTRANTRVLQGLVTMTAGNGWPPTLRELAGHLGGADTPGTVEHHLRRLAAMGLVRHTPKADRSWRAAVGPAAARLEPETVSE